MRDTVYEEYLSVNIMKKILVLLFLLAGTCFAQQIKTIAIEPLKIGDGERYFYPRFNHSGNQILLTSENYVGLKLLNLSTKELISISKETGAGYAATFSRDDQTVYFIENCFENRRKLNTLKSFDLTQSKIHEIEPATRSLLKPMVFDGSLFYKKSNEIRKVDKSGLKSSGNSGVYVAIESRKLIVYKNGESQNINPLNVESYIWPSISPDGRRILAYGLGEGAFICDIDGSNVITLGQIEAPVWMGNDFVVGMVTKDDGHIILEAKIVAFNIKQKEQSTLTPDSIISLNPSVNTGTNKIAFNTPDGVVMIINYQIDTK